MFFLIYFSKEIDLKPFDLFEPKNVLNYVQFACLSTDKEVIKFLKTRLTILMASLEKAQKRIIEEANAANSSNNNNLVGDTINKIFIRRLVDGEITILKRLVQIFND